MIANDVIRNNSLVSGKTISEQFPLLRTIQFTLNWATPEQLENEQVNL